MTFDLLNRSPYLRTLHERHPDIALRAGAGAAEEMIGALINDCAAISRTEDEAALRKTLRQIKAQAALVIAVADLSGAWTVDEVTHHQTRFADAALRAAVDFLLLQAHRAGKLALPDPVNLSQQSGYVVLAMGKHGASELNYSSDIDLIVLYDPDTAPLTDNIEAATFFVRLTRALVSILQDVTEDGYVFRTDLRLRPDPRATQVAIALEAAAIYYENLGQNWERAAMIKARAAAGDIALGEEFLDRLKPYVWRKYLDFAAIADVQSLKRQIHAVKGHGAVAVRGHNLKLGRGGIREIEFFVQTQQLISGGRNPELRGRRTLDMLHALAKAGWITQGAASELTSAYRLLRTLEHRVQMLEDAQDHCVPATEVAFENYARFAGFADGAALESKLRSTLETVQGHYQALFEQADELSAETGNLVFTGGEDDPGTIETLASLGFQQPSEVSAAIRGWHFGRYAATRSKRARELLTELMPQLLKSLAATGDAGQAFLAFDKFLQSLPAGVQLFSMIRANPHLLDLISSILGTAPRLAAQLSRQPRILEAVLDRAFFGPLPPLADLESMAADLLPDGLAVEEAMDRARMLGREQHFRVGVRLLSETVNADEAGLAFANIADVLLRRLHAVVSADMERAHGRVPEGASLIIAMGKLGGQEMTATSDLDLMLVYDHAADAVSDGPRPLSAPQYYARLAQRLITAISAPTAEGVLYEVDMRLRPSGSKGPVAVSLASFDAYQRESAWTWEKLALTRARIVAGPEHLRLKARAIIGNTLGAARDAEKTREDVRNMRTLMLREHKDQGLWDIKRKRGGLVEIEFIAQTLQLLHAAAFPAVLRQNTSHALAMLAEAKLIGATDAADMLSAFNLYSRLTHVLRLCVEGPFDPQSATSALNLIVRKAAHLPDLPSTESALMETAENIKKIFDKIIGKP